MPLKNRLLKRPNTLQSLGKKWKYLLIVFWLNQAFLRFRSTTSKRPQPKPETEYNDQKYSFTKNSKVKSPSRDAFERPIHQYNVNITHSEEDQKNANDLSVKSLESFRKEQSQEVAEDEPEYEEYDDDEDYGVILTEEDRIIKEKPTVKTTEPPPTTTPTTKTKTVATTTSKPEENTVIIFENFILPNNKDDEDQENVDDEGEIEYEYIDEEEEAEEASTTEKPPVTTTQAVEEKSTTQDNLEVTTYRHSNKILGQAVVSVVTSKTVVNGTTPKQEAQEIVVETTTEEENYPSSTKATPKKSTTEDYYVIASVQTSRSVSGAHFLPFEHVEQEEKKKSRIELANKKQPLIDHDNNTEEPEIKTTQITEVENVSSEIQDDDDYHNSHEVTSLSDDGITTLATTVKYAPLPSTESIIDKLDRVQSDLSLGVLSGEFPVLKDRSSKKTKPPTVKPLTEEPEEEVKEETPITTTVKPLVLIRKFSPKSTVSTTRRPTTTQKVIVKTSLAPAAEDLITTTPNSSITDTQRENKKIAFDVIPQDDLIGLLPTGYKPRNSFKNKKLFSSTTQQPAVKEEPVPTKSRNSTISRSYKAQSNAQNLNSPSFKGFKSKDKLSGSKATEDNETQVAPKKVTNKSVTADDEIVDINKFLPPDFKPANETEKLSVIPLDELSKFLPPGFKLDPTTEKPKIKLVDDEISKFLPPGYKPPADEEEEEKKPDDVLSSILGKIKFQEASDLVPTDFKETAQETPVYRPSTTEVPATTKASGKVVFPSRLGKKPGGGRLTTPKPSQAEGPKTPELEIRKGPPTRATTEFTGWPSKATTPISIERLLELQRNAMEINVADLLPKSTTTEATTSTTTTTTTTPRPTQPTVCRTECSLAATIRIIDGVEWSPELLTHHTDEYKNLAAELELELNEVYSNAPSLKQWFKKVRIDSFSKGSVLVDYYVELSDIPKDINTLEIKSLFHDALTPAPEKSESLNDEEGSPQPIVKEAFKLGNFLVDPVSTDFIGKIF